MESMAEYYARLAQDGGIDRIAEERKAKDAKDQPASAAVQEHVREFVIVPLDDRIVVQQEAEQAEEKSKGGIIVPDNIKEKPLRGQVIAVGTGRVFDNGDVRPLKVKEGDWIVFGRYAGVDLPEKEYGPNLLIMREDEVLGVLRLEE